MKINKKIFFAIPFVVAIVLFIALYAHFNMEDSDSFTSSERKWLQANKNTVESIEVINDYPIYGNSGVFDKFITKLSEATELEFNKVPYYRGTKTKSNDFGFKIVKEDSDITKNDILLNEDVYVALGKKERKIDRISDF